MTDQELKDLVASLAVNQKETAQDIRELRTNGQEARRQMQEFREGMEELRTIQKETARQMKRTDKQLGELGNRLGGYTEGLFYPGLEHILFTKLQMDTVVQRARSRRKDLELDVLGYTNGTTNTAYIVEIKSRANEDAVEQLLNTLAEFPTAFPEHAGKKVYGILAAVDVPPNIRRRVAKLGIYLVRTSNDVVKLEKPAKFIPKNYGPA